MNLYENFKKNLKESDWEDALKSGKVINVSNKSKNYAPADFKYSDGKVYYKNGPITGNNWTEHPNSLEDILKHFDKQVNDEGSTVTITDDVESTIDMDKLIDNDMTVKELDDTAQWLYDNNRDEWNKFTDNELIELAKLCLSGDWGRAYDDEVMDEMSRRGLSLNESAKLNEAGQPKVEYRIYYSEYRGPQYVDTEFYDSTTNLREAKSMAQELANNADAETRADDFAGNGKTWIVRAIWDPEEEDYEEEWDDKEKRPKHFMEFTPKGKPPVYESQKLGEMDNSNSLTKDQFEEYCKGKISNLGTTDVETDDWDSDEENAKKTVKVRVAFEQKIRNYGNCKVLNGEDTMDKLDSDGDTLEFVTEDGRYINTPMIDIVTLAGRLEFDKIDKEFYNSMIANWDDIEGFFESNTGVGNDNLETFNDILGEWDFIGEVTNPYVSGVMIDNGDTIGVSCELWDPDLDDYVSVDGGSYKAPEIVQMINSADFENSFNRYEVARPIVSAIENLVDWDKVSDELYKQVHTEMNESDTLDKDEYEALDYYLNASKLNDSGFYIKQDKNGVDHFIDAEDKNKKYSLKNGLKIVYDSVVPEYVKEYPKEVQDGLSKVFKKYLDKDIKFNESNLKEGSFDDLDAEYGAIKEINGKKYYVAGSTSQGMAYKNINTYNSDPDGICYICEHFFEDFDDADWQVPVDEVEKNKEKYIQEGGISTHNSIKEEVRTMLSNGWYYDRSNGERIEGKDFDDEIVDSLADETIEVVDWQSTGAFINADLDNDSVIGELIEDFYNKKFNESEQKSKKRKYDSIKKKSK